MATEAAVVKAGRASQQPDALVRRLVRRWDETTPAHRQILRRLLEGESLTEDLDSAMAAVLLGGVRSRS